MVVSGRAWLGAEKPGGEALVREQRQEVGWEQGKRRQKQKRWNGEQEKLGQEGIRAGQAGKMVI